MTAALIVIDVQRSFMHRPYWSEVEVPAFLNQTQRLVDHFRARPAPILQVFHVDPSCAASDPFSLRSGHIDTLPGSEVNATRRFEKSVHSAMFACDVEGASLDEWLRARGLQELVICGIRTEQCCETTARHASDLGYSVTYAMNATLTFAMQSSSGRWYSPQEIREHTALALNGRFARVLDVCHLTGST